MKRLLRAMGLSRPTVDEIAEAIHVADDQVSSAWPYAGGRPSFDADCIRYASSWEMETRRRHARAAAALLGIKLVED